MCVIMCMYVCVCVRMYTELKDRVLYIILACLIYLFVYVCEHMYVYVCVCVCVYTELKDRVLYMIFVCSIYSFAYVGLQRYRCRRWTSARPNVSVCV